MTDDEISERWQQIPEHIRAALEADPEQVVPAAFRRHLDWRGLIPLMTTVSGGGPSAAYEPTLEPEVIDWIQRRKDGQETTK